MFINDYQSVFCPILNISLLSPIYHGVNLRGRVSTGLSSFYYNPIARYWEPFVEPIKMHIIIDDITLKLITKGTFNVNISETLIHVLASTWKSWSEKPIQAKKSTNVFKQTAKIFLNSQKEDEGVCPFSIKNETTEMLFLKKKGDDSIVQIPKNTIMDIPVNYQETIHNLLQSTSNNVKLIEGLFQISFRPDLGYLPLENMNFASIANECHYIQNIQSAFNYLVCSVKLDRMITHLTIRTPFKLINKTHFDFKVSFDKFDKNGGFLLPVDETMAIPIDNMSSTLILWRNHGPSHFISIEIYSLLKKLKKRTTVILRNLILLARHNNWRA